MYVSGGVEVVPRVVRAEAHVLVRTLMGEGRGEGRGKEGGDRGRTGSTLAHLDWALHLDVGAQPLHHFHGFGDLLNL